MLEGSLKLGYDNGPGERVQARHQRPARRIGRVEVPRIGSYYDTDGYIDNDFPGSGSGPGTGSARRACA